MQRGSYFDELSAAVVVRTWVVLAWVVRTWVVQAWVVRRAVMDFL
jgi:hypothetical protein